MMVLDTNVLSEFMRREPSPAVIAWLDAQDPEDMAITAITVAELLYGLERLPGGRRRDALRLAVQQMIDVDFESRILPFDEPAAAHYAQLVALRERAGRPISMADAQIAAICLSHRCRLVTRNIADFESLGLGLIDPWSAV